VSRRGQNLSATRVGAQAGCGARDLSTDLRRKIAPSSQGSCRYLKFLTASKVRLYLVNHGRIPRVHGHVWISRVNDLGAMVGGGVVLAHYKGGCKEWSQKTETVVA